MTSQLSDQLVAAWRETKMPKAPGSHASWDGLGEIQKAHWRIEYAKEHAQSSKSEPVNQLRRTHMLDWQQRVIDEKKELDEKCRKLDEFIGHTYDRQSTTVSATVQRQLIRQHAAMTTYSEILGERIAAFEP